MVMGPPHSIYGIMGSALQHVCGNGIHPTAYMWSWDPLFRVYVVMGPTPQSISGHGTHPTACMWSWITPQHVHDQWLRNVGIPWAGHQGSNVDSRSQLTEGLGPAGMEPSWDMELTLPSQSSHSTVTPVGTSGVTFRSL